MNDKEIQFLWFPSELLYDIINLRYFLISLVNREVCEGGQSMD